MLWPCLRTAIAASSSPNLQFPSAPRDRIAIASYPFRETIAGAHDKPYSSKIPKMDLKNFVVLVKSKFNINKIEPWSEHFRSLDAKYLDELRSIVEKNDGAIVNIAVDGEHSPYALDKAEREKGIAFSKQWICGFAACVVIERADEDFEFLHFEIPVVVVVVFLLSLVTSGTIGRIDL